MEVATMTLLKFSDLRAKGITYGKVHLWRMVKDGRFPKPLKLRDAPGARNHWDEAEVDAFLASRKVARDHAA
jgi:predicted DNA-binding transcriptional regulator AlpA